jgi:hypothetical protein
MKNCEQIKNILRGQFGRPVLDEKENEHIQNCPDCRKYYDELKQLENNIKETSFEPLRATEFALVQDSLEKNINHYLNRAIGFYRFMIRYGTSLATVLLLFFVSIISNFDDVHYPYEESSVSNELFSYISQSNEEDALDDDYFDLLFFDYVQEHGVYSSELLLGDLYDEEYEYLTKKINVGDML